MNRLFSLMLISFFALVTCIRSSSKPPSDEETLKNLEIEAARNVGFSDANIAFQKGVFGSRVIGIDYLGHINDRTPATFEKIMIGIRKVNPDAKASVDMSDIKVVISGDTAVVTYRGTSTLSGLRDPNQNISAKHYVSLDIWQKQSGEWKVIAGAAVPTEPIPAEICKIPPKPATN
jgi:hypothetical protein